MEPKRRRDDSVFKFAVAILALMLMPVAIWAVGKGVQQIHAPVTPKSLNISVAVEAASGFPDLFKNCAKRTGGRWHCKVTDEGGSGYRDFVVTVRPESSCWDAAGMGKYDRGPRPRLSSCVNYFEQGWWGLIF